jgi:anti-sigma factor RsiW
MGALEMNCRRALELMDCVLDGSASREEEQMLHFHLSGCPGCKRAMQMNRDISSVCRQIPRPQPPADLEARIRARLAAMPEEKPSKPFRRYRIAIVLPFAAALLIAIGLAAGGRSSTAATDAVEAVRKVAVATQGAAKYSITTPPLAAYARPANLISF